MTQAELDAIPTEQTEFGCREVTLPNGQIACVPVAPNIGALFDPIYVIDAYGGRWALCEVDGRRIKRRV